MNMAKDAAATGQVSTSAAEIYDEFFVPALFGEWAGPLCAAAGLVAGDQVLDVACGTGATTRVARSEVGTGGSVKGLDRNEGMLKVARSRAPDLSWVEGRAEALPFPDAAFDAVLCQFGLMFFDDRAAALREMSRVVRPSGKAVVSVWDTAETSPGYARMIALIDRLFGSDAANALRAPFVLGEKDALRSVLRDGGWEDATVTTEIGTARFASIFEWVRMDVRGWTLADMIDDEQFSALVAAAERELAVFAGPDGSVAFPAPAHIITWTRPQQAA